MVEGCHVDQKKLCKMSHPVTSAVTRTAQSTIQLTGANTQQLARPILTVRSNEMPVFLTDKRAERRDTGSERTGRRPGTNRRGSWVSATAMSVLPIRTPITHFI